MEHAKWSPVSTAWYTLLPEVRLLRAVEGDEALALAAELPGLVSVVGEGGQQVARVGEARSFPLLLEKVSCLMRALRVYHNSCYIYYIFSFICQSTTQARRMSGESPWQGVLQLRKRKDHFITTVESTGVLPATDLVLEALQVLQDKCDRLLMRL